MDYIIENYVVKDNLCLDGETENSISKRVSQSKLLKVGVKAPELVLPDENGNEFRLDSIKKENILLVFYSIKCPHCKTMLPEIHKVYKKRSDIEVVAVSLDTEKDEWKSYLNENKFSWINVSDLKGWEGNSAKDYYIYATPTMFLLDKKGIIMAKPVTFDELEKVIW